VHGDLDDTRIAVPRTPDDRPAEADGDATIVRGSLPAPVPPALIEPPQPERRPLPEVVAPLVPVIDDIPVVPLAPAPEPSVPRFRVRLADGREFDVDRPVYVGRKPSTPRIHTGPAPHLVTIPSPSRELSATHVELRVVGGALVATDMRSTNGTVVTLPRSAPRTLIRGESIVVVPGSRIDLGDGAILDILDPEGDS
jgi:FHA domain.